MASCLLASVECSGEKNSVSFIHIYWSKEARKHTFTERTPPPGLSTICPFCTVGTSNMLVPTLTCPHKFQATSPEIEGCFSYIHTVVSLIHGKHYQMPQALDEYFSARQMTFTRKLTVSAFLHQSPSLVYDFKSILK